MKIMNLIKKQNLLRSDWFPLTRDTLFLSCLLPSAYEMARTGIVWWEAFILLILYMAQLLIMKYNRLY